jgi:NhaP-type Na+/H+ or K+/H+ antiporter
MYTEKILNKQNFLEKSALVLNNINDIFYLSIVQILVGLFISYLLDNFMYKNYDNTKDENKSLLLLTFEFTLLCSFIVSLSFGISKLLIYLPYPFTNTLHNNFNFNHKSNVLNKNDAILTIILFSLCKPLQSKLKVIKNKLGFVSIGLYAAPYNTPKKELPK